MPMLTGPAVQVPNPSRPPRRAADVARAPAVDGGLASARVTAVVAVVTFAVTFTFALASPGAQMSLPGALLTAAASAGAVLLSAWRADVALGAVAVTLCILPAVGSAAETMDLVVIVVALQAVWRTHRPLWAILAVGFVALTVNDVWLRVSLDRAWLDPSVLYPALITALVGIVGVESRRRRRQQEELNRLREVERDRAVLDERRRIARDLHDVAAHHLTALVVRNKLALRLGTDDALGGAVRFSAETANVAFDAIRGVVTLLSDGDAPPTAPQPTFSDLDAIVARMSAAGLDIVHSGDPPTSVRDDVEAAVVRIVQEALSNVLRHRGPGRCWLAFTSTGTWLQVSVEDDGRDGTTTFDPAATGRGNGIAGMRHRADGCGGRLDVGPSGRGGWKIVATVPR